MVGDRMVTLQSLLTIEEDTSPFNFKPNEPFSKFLRQQTTILKFLSYVFRENTTFMCVWGGGRRDICPLITLTLKKRTIASDYQSNEPSPNDRPFYKNHVSPQGITYSPCPEVRGGGVSSSKS